MKIYKLGNHSSLFRDTDGKSSSLTMLGYLKFYYNNLVKRSERFKESICSWKEFRNHFFMDDLYNDLYLQWCNKNFSQAYTPHAKQKLNSTDYTISNIEWFCRKTPNFSKEEFEAINLKESIVKIKHEQGFDKYYMWNASLKRYNLTRKDWNKLVIESNGICQICEEPFKNASNDCHIDHDHETKIVRGLLCARCNHLLAGLEDVKFKKRAENYLS